MYMYAGINADRGVGLGLVLPLCLLWGRVVLAAAVLKAAVAAAAVACGRSGPSVG